MKEKTERKERKEHNIIPSLLDMFRSGYSQNEDAIRITFSVTTKSRHQKRLIINFREAEKTIRKQQKQKS
jgi:DNA invertase Pin-like site-specific DNA recombinase